MKSKLYFFVIATLFVLSFSMSVNSEPLSSQDKIIYANLTSNDSKEIQSALKEIKKRKPLALVDSIVELVLDDEGSIQSESALMALELYPKVDFVSSWLYIIKKSENYKLKIKYLNYLSGLNDRKLVFSLSKMLTSPYREIRESSARILSKIGDDRMYPVILGISDSLNPVERIYFIDAMKYLYDNRFHNMVIKMLKDDNKSVRIYVIKAIVANKIRNTLHLIRSIALNDKNDEVRIAALNALQLLKDKKALFIFIKALSSENTEIRFEAAKAIKKNKLVRAVNSLSARLINEESNRLKNIILDILIEMKKVGDPAGVRKIIISDESVELRIKAVVLLGLLKGKRFEKNLIESLKDRNYMVRAEAANSLGNYRSKVSLDALIYLLKNESRRYVKSSALYAIKRLRMKKAIEKLFMVFSYEKDPVFRSMMRENISGLLKEYL